MMNQFPMHQETRPESSPSKLAILLKLWLMVLPVTSVLVVPSIQGTTPGNVLALLVLFPLGHGWMVPAADWAFVRRLLLCLLIIGISLAASQLALSLSDLTANDFAAVPKASRVGGMYLRTSLATQSAYLIAGLIVFCFFWTYYRVEWDSWLLAGALLLAGYGFFEVAWSAATGRPGDFLSNRTFDGGLFPGSLTQFHHVFGVTLLRLKSLTGEPSMYAVTMIPYAMLALARGRRLVAVVLVLSLILTVSTTAYIGLALAGAYFSVCYAASRRWAVAIEAYAVLVVAVGVVLLYAEPLASFLDQVVVAKLMADTPSGVERAGTFRATVDVWREGSILTQLFGVGFGFVRSPVLFSTLLVNIGAVGLLGWVALYLAPLLSRQKSITQQRWSSWCAAIVLALMLVAVPEFAYLTSWAFLGLAYAGSRAVDARTSSRVSNDPAGTGTRTRAVTPVGLRDRRRSPPRLDVR